MRKIIFPSVCVRRHFFLVEDSRIRSLWAYNLHLPSRYGGASLLLSYFSLQRATTFPTFLSSSPPLLGSSPSSARRGMAKLEACPLPFYWPCREGKQIPQIKVRNWNAYRDHVEPRYVINERALVEKNFEHLTNNGTLYSGTWCGLLDRWKNNKNAYEICIH